MVKIEQFRDDNGSIFLKPERGFLVTDCDGVLTDGYVTYTDGGARHRRFSVRDGSVINELKEYGILTMVVSGENDMNIHERCKKLDIPFMHAFRDKTLDVGVILALLGMKFSQIAAIGDWTNDLTLLEQAGYAACPVDAHVSVKRYCATRAWTGSGYVDTGTDWYGYQNRFATIAMRIAQDFWRIKLPEYNSHARR